jgi:Gas vesicle synthesis protein GvpO
MAKQTAEQREQTRDRREERRRLAAEPFERLDEAARANETSASGRALKQMLATAAAGAVVAGIAGAAKALRDRRSSGQEAAAGGDPGTGEARRTADAPEPDQDREADEEREAPGADPREADNEQAEGDAEKPAAKDGPQALDEGTRADARKTKDAQPAEDPDEAAAEEPERADGASAEDSPQDSGANDDQKDEAGKQRGAPAGDLKKLVEKARRQLQEILGVEPESVSGFERKGDQWTVSVEVVEVRRIPDSTDVLSSYEVTLDEDGNLIGASQRRRYRRSQVEEG